MVDKFICNAICKHRRANPKLVPKNKPTRLLNYMFDVRRKAFIIFYNSIYVKIFCVSNAVNTLVISLYP